MSALQTLIQSRLDGTGMTPAELARKSGISSQQIGYWRNGTRALKEPLRPDTVAALAKGLGVQEVLVWQAVLSDLGSDVRLVPDDVSPDRAVLISAAAQVPDQQLRRVTAIVQQFLDED